MVHSPRASPGAGSLFPDNPNWRRHKNACIFYRERWTAEEEMGDEGCPLLYQIICLVGTPPLNAAEQDKCMRPRTSCWRDASIKCTKAAAAEFDERARAAAAGSHAH
jgi:hypothetical protein